MIWHLFRKDLRRLWVVAIVFLTMCILLCAAVFAPDYLEENDYIDATEIVLAGLLLHMLVFGNLMNVEKYEEKQQACRILAPLPVSGFEIVAAKFLSVFLNTIVGITAISVIFGLFGVGDAWPGLKLRYLLLTGALTLVLNGVSYLGVYRFGYHRVRAGIMAVYILALAGPQILSFLHQVGGKRNFLLAVAETGVPAVLGWLASALAVFAACLFASVKAQESREL